MGEWMIKQIKTKWKRKKDKKDVGAKSKEQDMWKWNTDCLINQWQEIKKRGRIVLVN